MENLAGPGLLQAFFDHASHQVLSNMDNPTKAALRLSCKNAKSFVDSTVTTAAGVAYVSEALLRCDWQLSELTLRDEYPTDASLSRSAFNSLLHALFSKFPTLQVLEMNIPTALSDLPANIGQLSKLNTLQIKYAYFTALPASFGQLSSLERLELYTPADSSQLTIEGLAPLKQLTQLKHLKLYGGLVWNSFFPDWLGSCHFPVLEDLTLGGELQSLPSSISNFSNLTSLYIRGRAISEVPESIGSLQFLKKLVLRQWSRVNLPTSFSKLTALEDLDVITDMQNFALVEHASKLTKLDFHQQMEEGVIMPYPEFLWTFTSLQMLSLTGSALPSLPDALGNLENLEVLHLRLQRNLEELPESLDNLTCLTSFKIEDCPMLIKLPESVGNLKNLRELNICRCRQVKTLPELIGNLKNLEKLCLKDFENFERLPSSIGNLHALKELTVGNAGEVFVPESFADLVDKPAEECSLEKVSFSGNTKVSISGPRASLALGILWQRRLLHGNNGFSFS